MEVSDLPQFRETYDVMCMIYRRQFEEKVFKAFWIHLRRYPIMDVYIAIHRHIHVSSYFPDVCKIVDKIKEVHKNDQNVKEEKTWDEEFRSLHQDLAHFEKLLSYSDNEQTRNVIDLCKNQIKEHLQKKGE